MIAKITTDNIVVLWNYTYLSVWEHEAYILLIKYNLRFFNNSQIHHLPHLCPFTGWRRGYGLTIFDIRYGYSVFLLLLLWLYYIYVAEQVKYNNPSWSIKRNESLRYDRLRYLGHTLQFAPDWPRSSSTIATE